MTSPCLVVFISVFILCSTPGSRSQTTLMTTPSPIAHDVFFLIDCSESVGQANFKALLNQILEVYIKQWPIGEDQVRVGVIAFSTTFTMVGLTGNLTQLEQQVPLMFYEGRGTNTYIAFDQARTSLMSSRQPGRQQHVIVITDGVSRFPSVTKNNAEKLRNDGVDMWAIGVGGDFRVLELAWYTGDILHVSATPTFGVLPDIGINIPEVQTTTAPPVITPTSVTSSNILASSSLLTSLGATTETQVQPTSSAGPTSSTGPTSSPGPRSNTLQSTGFATLSSSFAQSTTTNLQSSQTTNLQSSQTIIQGTSSFTQSGLLNPTTTLVQNPTTTVVQNPTTTVVQNPTTTVVQNPTTSGVQNPTTNLPPASSTTSLQTSAQISASKTSNLASSTGATTASNVASSTGATTGYISTSFLSSSISTPSSLQASTSQINSVSSRQTASTSTVYSSFAQSSSPPTSQIIPTPSSTTFQNSQLTSSASQQLSAPTSTLNPSSLQSSSLLTTGKLSSTATLISQQTTQTTLINPSLPTTLINPSTPTTLINPSSPTNSPASTTIPTLTTPPSTRIPTTGFTTTTQLSRTTTLSPSTTVFNSPTPSTTVWISASRSTTLPPSSMATLAPSSYRLPSSLSTTATMPIRSPGMSSSVWQTTNTVQPSYTSSINPTQTQSHWQSSTDVPINRGVLDDGSTSFDDLENAGICCGAVAKTGFGYVSHPTDIDKFIQCHRSQNKVTAAVRTCPIGQSWSQDWLKCVNPWSNCGDACKRKEDGLTYKMVGQCGLYWECSNGVSVVRSCRPQEAYVSNRGCVYQPNCKYINIKSDACGGSDVCELKPLRYNSGYKIKLNVGWAAIPCLYHTEFDLASCSCRPRHSFYKDCKWAASLGPTTEIFNNRNNNSNISDLQDTNQQTMMYVSESSFRPFALQFQFRTMAGREEVILQSRECDQGGQLVVSADNVTINILIFSYRSIDDSLEVSLPLEGLEEEWLEVTIVYSRGELSIEVTGGDLTYTSLTKGGPLIQFGLCGWDFGTSGGLEGMSDFTGEIRQMQISRCFQQGF